MNSFLSSPVKKQFAIALGLTIVAGLVLIMMNDDQCPADFTQEQIDEANCIVGANIGIGIVVMFFAPMVLVAWGVAIYTWLQSRKHK